MNNKRIIVDIVLLLGIFYLPWWVVIIGASIALFTFNTFYEILALGLIIDSLYNAPVTRFYHFQFIITVMACMLVIISEIAKRKLRFYANR